MENCLVSENPCVWSEEEPRSARHIGPFLSQRSLNVYRCLHLFIFPFTFWEGGGCRGAHMLKCACTTEHGWKWEDTLQECSGLQAWQQAPLPSWAIPAALSTKFCKLNCPWPQWYPLIRSRYLAALMLLQPSKHFRPKCLNSVLPGAFPKSYFAHPWSRF